MDVAFDPFGTYDSVELRSPVQLSILTVAVMSQPVFFVQEVEFTSYLYKNCMATFGKELSSFKLLLAAADSSEIVLGVCGFSPDSDIVSLNLILKKEIKSEEKAAVIYALLQKSVAILRQRYANLIMVANVRPSEHDQFAQHGFVLMKSSSNGYEAVFPPPRALIEKYCGNGANTRSSANISMLLRSFLEMITLRTRHHLDKAFEFVPLVFLRHLLDVEKIGRILVHMFVFVSCQVQCLQGRVINPQEHVKMVDTETTLLNVAYERLNTGHYSEVEECWRILYAAASYIKAVRLATAEKLLNAIAAVDFGLLMGDGIPDQLLQRYAHHLASQLPPVQKISVCRIMLSVPKSLPNSTPIRELSELSKWDFVDRFLARSEPVIVRGLNNYWLACKNWDFNYLHRILCHRVIPVEQGSKYTDSEWSQGLMTGSEFFNSLLGNGSGPLYLAQHRLFNQVPELCEDFTLPLYCDHCEDVDKNCWIGPGGTLSPLHTDPRENLFCQIMGRKFIRLIAPADTDCVYPIRDGIITNTSQVDALNPDLKEYPNFAKVGCWDGVLEAGDVLFIPKGWWHLVYALTNSISISFWFDKLK